MTKKIKLTKINSKGNDSVLKERDGSERQSSSCGFQSWHHLNSESFVVGRQRRLLAEPAPICSVDQAGPSGRWVRPQPMTAQHCQWVDSSLKTAVAAVGQCLRWARAKATMSWPRRPLQPAVKSIAKNLVTLHWGRRPQLLLSTDHNCHLSDLSKQQNKSTCRMKSINK